MDESEVLIAKESVRKYILDFDYDQLVAELKKPGVLKARSDETSVGYEKVQIFRIMLMLDPESLKGDDVFTKICQ